MIRVVTRASLFVSCSLLLGSGIASRHVAAQSTMQVIASGLDNPRGLAFGPDNALYVAEAGRGGVSALCVPAPDPPFAPRCYGPTGAITRVSGLGVQQRVVTGLPSVAMAGGAIAQGPNDIDFGLGYAWVTVGLGGNPAIRAPLDAAGIKLGHLVRVESNGQWSPVVDLAAFESAANPDGLAPDSNPVSLRVRPDGVLVVDAGGNTVVKAALDGTMSTFAVFPRRPVPGGAQTMDSVPTSLATAPDGTLYVAELTGAPFPQGAAQVYRVPAGGGTPVAVLGGFTMIIDIAADSRGNGYVLEHDIDGLFGPGQDGRLTRIAPDGSRTVLASAGLTRPGGVAVGPDGAVYVTIRSISPGVGEVVRIQ